MKKKPAKTTKKHVVKSKKTNSLFTNNQDWLLFAASLIVISICVFYIFNLFQM